MMLEYGTMRFKPHHMNSVLFDTGEAFPVSSGNIIRDIFAKFHLPSLSPPNMIKDTQTCVDSIQISSKSINQVVEDIRAPIRLLTKSTNDPMVIIRAKGSTRQLSRKIFSGRKRMTQCKIKLSYLFRR